MGDEILMKKIISLTITASVALFAAQENGTRTALIKDYKMMFERIGQKRIGADEKEIEKVNPPFIRLTKEEAKKIVVKKDGTKVAVKQEYTLQAILNDRAKISGKWYKKGDAIGDYLLATIKNDVVYLQSKTDDFKKRLTLRKKNEKISIK